MVAIEQDNDLETPISDGIRRESVLLTTPFERNNTRVSVPANLNNGVVRVKYYYSGGTGGINGHAIAGESLAFDNDGSFILITRAHANNGALDGSFYKKLQEELNSRGYNITGFETDTYSGVSSGIFPAANAFRNRINSFELPITDDSKNIESSSNRPSPVYLNLYDPTTSGVGNLQVNFTADELSRIRQSGSAIRFITIGSRKKKWLESSGIKKIAAAGVNTILISGNDGEGSKNGHEQCYKCAVRCGWEDFFDGTIDLIDVKNEVTYKKKVGRKTVEYTYNYDYKINVPSVDENGNVTWTEYKLSQLQEWYRNITHITPEQLAVLKYIEGCRTSVDYDFLGSINSIRDNIKRVVRNNQYKALEYGSTSALLAAENGLMKQYYDRTKDAFQDVLNNIAKTNEAKENWTELDIDLSNLTIDIPGE